MTRKKLETRIVYGQKLLHLHIRQMGIFVSFNSYRRCKNLVSLLDDHRLLQWNYSLPLCKLLISSLSRDLISAWSLFYAKIPNIFCSWHPFLNRFLLSNARQGIESKPSPFSPFQPRGESATFNSTRRTPAPRASSSTASSSAEPKPRPRKSGETQRPRPTSPWKMGMLGDLNVLSFGGRHNWGIKTLVH